MVFCKKIYKEDITLIVHCSAGISRSGAVGTFVNQYLNLDTQKFCFKYSSANSSISTKALPSL